MLNILNLIYLKEHFKHILIPAALFIQSSTLLFFFKVPVIMYFFKLK